MPRSQPGADEFQISNHCPVEQRCCLEAGLDSRPEVGPDSRLQTGLDRRLEAGFGCSLEAGLSWSSPLPDADGDIS